MGEGRQRLRPWLERILNEGKITGVEWLDDSRTKFRIPWKHGGKHDWNPEDGQIFKAYAKLMKHGDPANWTKDSCKAWKHKLRCALNKQDGPFKFLKPDSSEEYRVYQLKPEVHRKTCTIPSSATSSQTSPLPSSSETALVPMESSPVIPSVVEECRSSAMEVTLLYSNHPHITYQVPLDPGCFRLCYISSIEEIQERDLEPDTRKVLYGSDQAIKIIFEKGRCADIEGASNTANHILDNFSRGVEVTNRDDSIYVKRFCKVRIFHLSEIETHGKPVKISREEEVKIFNYESFESKVRNYSKYRTDVAPEPKVFLQIGQSVPLDEMNEKILLCASVVSTKAKECLERAKKERANTSEMSIDLSVSDEYDNFERCIKHDANVILPGPVMNDLLSPASLQIDGEDELSVGLCVDINTAVENLSLDDPDLTPKATDDPFIPLCETKSEDEENSDPIH